MSYSYRANEVLDAVFPIPGEQVQGFKTPRSGTQVQVERDTSRNRPGVLITIKEGFVDMHDAEQLAEFFLALQKRLEQV